MRMGFLFVLFQFYFKFHKFLTCSGWCFLPSLFNLWIELQIPFSWSQSTFCIFKSKCFFTCCFFSQMRHVSTIVFPKNLILVFFCLRSCCLSIGFEFRGALYNRMVVAWTSIVVVWKYGRCYRDSFIVWFSGCRHESSTILKGQMGYFY